jgi:hypothetical protein
LESRFHRLPPELVQRIEAQEDLDRLHECARLVMRINAPEELPL